MARNLVFNKAIKMNKSTNISCAFIRNAKEQRKGDHVMDLKISVKGNMELTFKNVVKAFQQYFVYWVYWKAEDGDYVNSYFLTADEILSITQVGLI